MFPVYMNFIVGILNEKYNLTVFQTVVQSEFLKKSAYSPFW